METGTRMSNVKLKMGNGKLSYLLPPANTARRLITPFAKSYDSVERPAHGVQLLIGRENHLIRPLRGTFPSRGRLLENTSRGPCHSLEVG